MTTTFAVDVDEERLSNLAMWLDQELHTVLRDADGPESHAPREVRFRVRRSMSDARLDEVCRRVDACWSRILPDLQPATTHRRED